MRKNHKKKGIIFTGTIVGMHLINKYLFHVTAPLNNNLEGEENYFFSQYGKVYYTKRGSGEPVLMLHGLASGTASFIWQKNFDALSNYFTVYAIDMPGFGKSQKLPITYRAGIFQNVIKAFIKEVIGEPVNVMAEGQAAAYAVQLKYNNPGILKSIILICPTGIFEQATPSGGLNKLGFAILRTPVLGTFFYNTLVSGPVRKYHIKNKSYFNNEPAIIGLLNYYKRSSRQGGYLSKYAPASLLGGYLNQDICESLENINTPLYIIWGRNTKMNRVENLRGFMDIRPDADFCVFENCGLMPQVEYPEKFNEICIDFLRNGKFIQ